MLSPLKLVRHKTGRGKIHKQLYRASLCGGVLDLGDYVVVAPTEPVVTADRCRRCFRALQRPLPSKPRENDQIIAGMGVPTSFVFGEAHWSGASVNLRALEAEMSEAAERIYSSLEAEAEAFLALPEEAQAAEWTRKMLRIVAERLAGGPLECTNAEYHREGWTCETCGVQEGD